MTTKKGVLLLNIGSPKSYEVADVAKYLKTFLMDKDVINLPFVFRWILVHGIIVPRRAPFSAGNYKKVWMENEGSPLTVYTQRFADKLQRDLGPSYAVKIGMNYSEPSVEQALKEFADEKITTILLAPLFPQFAEATTGSSVRSAERRLQMSGLNAKTQVLPPFFESQAFIEPSVRIAKEALAGKKNDHLLFSFHGLPESHLRRIEGCRLNDTCCLEKTACARNCYRAQCLASAQKIAEGLGLEKSQWSMSFQSRLGRAEWLKPSTDDALKNLAESGKKNLAVICPSFVADCIETLEEIGMGGEELFKEHGGESFTLIPCLNEDSEWTSKFATLIQQTVSDPTYKA